MSDEFLDDPLDFYDWPEVECVMRFYPREELNGRPNVLTIPLGPHWIPSESGPALKERKYIWSFVGTNWKSRSEFIEPLVQKEPHFLELFQGWNHSENLTKDAYIQIMLNTKFIPCFRGNNVETFRFYEALECGCIPIFTELPDVLKGENLPFVQPQNWHEVLNVLTYFENNTVDLESYQSTVMQWWANYKVSLKQQVTKWLT
jgi:hypothetical protein